MNAKNLILLTLLWGLTKVASAGASTSATCGVPEYIKTINAAGGNTVSCLNDQDYVPYPNAPDMVWEGASAAYASADYGVLKALAFTTGDSYANVQSSANAVFSDTLTIRSEGMDGKKGTVTFAFVHDWTGSLAQHGGDWSQHYWAEVGTSLSVLATTPDTVVGSFREERSYSDHASLWNANNNGVAVDAGTPMLLTIPFTFGVPIEVSMSLSVYSNGQGSWAAELDAAHSAYWGGISALQTDAPLNQGVTIAGVSGTDYSLSFVPVSPVPEPHAYLLVLAGTALLMLRAGRCRAE